MRSAISTASRTGDFTCLHVGDVAALDPAAFALPAAKHPQASILVMRDDEGANLRRTNVERGDQLLVLVAWHLDQLSVVASGMIGSPGSRG
jgi:hypothetical protein